jgi:uroporphyrinogen decarboxylase
VSASGDARAPRERFLATLDGAPPRPGERVPHFELVFFLTMEAFGRVHPNHRRYAQWDQMEPGERQLHRRDMADLYVRTAERFGHDAILLQPNPGTLEETLRLVDLANERGEGRYCLMLHADATYSVPPGDRMTDFAYRLVDDPEGVHDQAERMVEEQLRRCAALAEHGGVEALALCADYCFNTGPFLSPDQFAEFVAPYLARLVAGQREMGFRVIKHTDGNIMPILDALVEARPHALHSLDPQGGIDLAAVKRRVGDRVCLIGNVNCGALDTGTDEEVVESARVALAQGMPGGRYVFSTSNCIYTGMRLARYELMLDVWRREGVYR